MMMMMMRCRVERAGLVVGMRDRAWRLGLAPRECRVGVFGRWD